MIFSLKDQLIRFLHQQNNIVQVLETMKIIFETLFS